MKNPYFSSIFKAFSGLVIDSNKSAKSINENMRVCDRSVSDGAEREKKKERDAIYLL